MFIREKIHEFQTRIEHIPAELMITNPLTTGLTVRIFVEHVTHMRIMRFFMYHFSGNFLYVYVLPFFRPHLLHCHVY